MAKTYSAVCAVDAARPPPIAVVFPIVSLAYASIPGSETARDADVASALPRFSNGSRYVTVSPGPAVSRSGTRRRVKAGARAMNRPTTGVPHVPSPFSPWTKTRCSPNAVGRTPDQVTCIEGTPQGPVMLIPLV